MNEDRLVVVGASVAGTKLARAVRERGWLGEIALVDAAGEWPHDKPALSKGFLLGTDDEASVALETPASFEKLGIRYRPVARATGLDLLTRTVTIADGPAELFDQLVIATGCQARRIDFLQGVRGVHYVRTATDATALAADLPKGKRLVVVGGGFIGAEVAAAARTTGSQVTIVDNSAWLMHRVLPKEVADEIAAIHAGNGVEIRYLSVVIGAEVADGRISAILLGDGTRLPADVVVVGIGTVPNTKWLKDSGLELADGIVCDRFLQTSDPAVWAIGDIANWRNDRYGRSTRMQHWTSAREQAGVVAHNLTSGAAGRKSYSCVPYVWSDQYSSRIQHVGLAGDLVERVDVPKGQVFLHVTDAQIVGATAIDAQRELLKLRRLLVTPLLVGDYSAAL